MNQFHFMHPLWLLALLPLAGLLWLLYQYKSGSSSQVWDKVIDANLLPFLLSGNDTKASRSLFYLLAAGWLITVVALADPVWQKIPRPIFQTNAARVIVLDLSRSMLVPDLKPSRLARARFKIEDILSRKEEGQTGLVVFAGDAFTASPLTRDADTIRSLLQVLTPDIMPAQGSRADLGLAKAHDLLKQANINKGQVLLIADGVVGDLASKQARALKQGGFTVSVLGVGTKKGGVIPNFRMLNGVPIIAKLDEKALQAVAKAGGGAYHTISNSNSDLQTLLNPLRSDALAQANDNKKQHQGLDEKSQDWKSSGPYFVLLLIPLAALAFRRGWLFSIFLLVGISGMMVTPQPAMAFSFSDLWQRPDQQADKALQHKDFKKASQLAQDPLRRGSAEYKQGKFEQALQSFSEAKGADAAYNRGNTLAQLKKYQDAIKAYEEALQQDPTNQDAKANKEAIEKLLKQQKKNQKHQQQDKTDKDKKENKNQKGEKKGDKKQSDKKNNKQNKQSKNGQKKDKQQGQQGNKKQQEKNGKKGDKDKKDNQFSDAAKKLKEKNKQDKDKSADNAEKQAQNKGQQTNKQDAVKDKRNAKKDTEKNKKQDKKQPGNMKQAKQKPPKQTRDKDLQGTKTAAEELSQEEKMAAEQWLRRIPDDPGGLLRRKFMRQYRQQRRPVQQGVNPW